jgi:hypothetical protein
MIFTAIRPVLGLGKRSRHGAVQRFPSFLIDLCFAAGFERLIKRQYPQSVDLLCHTPDSLTGVECYRSREVKPAENRSFRRLRFSTENGKRRAKQSWFTASRPKLKRCP